MHEVTKIPETRRLECIVGAPFGVSIAWRITEFLKDHRILQVGNLYHPPSRVEDPFNKGGPDLLKETILALLGKFQRAFSVYHKKLVYIEGGLGSQILSIISFWERQEEFGAGIARCDLSYFSSPNRGSLWNWELDNFGISLNELHGFESTSVTKILRMKSDFLSEIELNTNYWIEVRKKYLNRFYFNPQLMNEFVEEITKSKDLKSFAAVHIRRGDYLKVASKVIDFNEYLVLLKAIQGLIPKYLFIISDSQLQEKEKETLGELFGYNHNLVFLDDPYLDSLLIHCILREADVLVTSNSTFSFSAALLGKSGQLAFSPVNFHSGQNTEKYNRSFRAAGSFMALKMEK